MSYANHGTLICIRVSQMQICSRGYIANTSYEQRFANADFHHVCIKSVRQLYVHMVIHLSVHGGKVVSPRMMKIVVMVMTLGMVVLMVVIMFMVIVVTVMMVMMLDKLVMIVLMATVVIMMIVMMLDILVMILLMTMVAITMTLGGAE